MNSAGIVLLGSPAHLVIVIQTWDSMALFT